MRTKQAAAMRNLESITTPPLNIAHVISMLLLLAPNFKEATKKYSACIPPLTKWLAADFAWAMYRILCKATFMVTKMLHLSMWTPASVLCPTPHCRDKAGCLGQRGNGDFQLLPQLWMWTHVAARSSCFLSPPPSSWCLGWLPLLLP